MSDHSHPSHYDPIPGFPIERADRYVVDDSQLMIIDAAFQAELARRLGAPLARRIADAPTLPTDTHRQARRALRMDRHELKVLALMFGLALVIALALLTVANYTA
jgi:hypothetical protein